MSRYLHGATFSATSRRVQPAPRGRIAMLRRAVCRSLFDASHPGADRGSAVWPRGIRKPGSRSSSTTASFRAGLRAWRGPSAPPAVPCSLYVSDPTAELYTSDGVRLPVHDRGSHDTLKRWPLCADRPSRPDVRWRSTVRLRFTAEAQPALSKPRRDGAFEPPTRPHLKRRRRCWPLLVAVVRHRTLGLSVAVRH